jgi:uncharacterized protein (TIGR01777 family)
MKIAVTGSHGLIARHLIPALAERGHDVVRVVRSGAAGTDITWDPMASQLDPADLAGVEAVVHLAGAGIGDHRWNAERKHAILASRVQGTALMARTIAQLDPAPKVFVSGSAIGYYGNRDDELLNEASASGSGFLADVCRRWEAAAAPALEAGIRTVLVRSGVVQAADGGALKAQLPLFKLALGARFGRGRQWVSWIATEDEVGGIIHAIEHDAVSGPLNLVAPTPVTNAEFTATLGRVLGRPALLVVPPLAVKLVLGPEMATEMLIAGQRVEPVGLETTGYSWTYRSLEPALRAALGR